LTASLKIALLSFQICFGRRQRCRLSPFSVPINGIIKRQWGFYFVSTKKGIKHASADVGFMFTALNLRRLMNIIDKNVLKKFLKEIVFET
jgi:hypothetical protein